MLEAKTKIISNDFVHTIKIRRTSHSDSNLFMCQLWVSVITWDWKEANANKEAL